jgi:hypothetical protein
MVSPVCATGRNRTYGRLFRKEQLYPLSYCGGYLKNETCGVSPSSAMDSLVVAP